MTEGITDSPGEVGADEAMMPYLFQAAPRWEGQYWGVCEGRLQLAVHQRGAEHSPQLPESDLPALLWRRERGLEL